MGKYPHEVAWMDQLAYAAECALRDYRPQVQPVPVAARHVITVDVVAHCADDTDTACVRCG